MHTPFTKHIATGGVALAAAQVAIFAPSVSAFTSGDEAEALLKGSDENLTLSAVDGGAVEVTGFIHLVSAKADVKEFMLVSDMGVCPWCGEAGHGTALEVQLADADNALEHGQRITVRGTLEEMAGEDVHLTTRLVAASVL